MVCAKTTVLHESGLHMRPAQEFVSAVANYPCKVIIKVGGEECQWEEYSQRDGGRNQTGYSH